MPRDVTREEIDDALRQAHSFRREVAEYKESLHDNV